MLSFQAKLNSSESKNSQLDEANDGDNGDGNTKEHYHGQVLEGNSDDDDDLVDWNKGKLKFKKHVDDKFRGMIGGDGRFADDYEVLDARDHDKNTHTKSGSSSSRVGSGNRGGSQRK